MNIYPFTDVDPYLVKDVKFIICDVDNTVCNSCSVIEEDVASSIAEITKKGYLFGFMSGTDNLELIRMIGNSLVFNHNTKKMMLMGNSGSHVITAEEDSFKLLYCNNQISDQDRTLIKNVLAEAIKDFKLPCHSDKNDQILDRGNQITLSCIGRTAPSDLKEKFDPLGNVREVIRNYLTMLLPGFSIRSGGTTSIDILPGEFDKGTGLQDFINFEKCSPNNIIFYGDSFSPTGNDFPASRVVNCIEVGNPREFNASIRSLFLGESHAFTS